MNPWRPHPRAMDDDARLLLCSPEAQAVAYRLSARAVGGRVSVGPAPEAAVVAHCGGAPWAAKGLEELIATGLVVPEDGALVLVWGWPTLTGGALPSSGASAPSAPGEASPRDTDPRAAARRLYALLSRAGLKTPAARAAWVDSPAGARFVAREQLADPAHDRAWAVDLASRVAGDNRGRFGCHRAATTPGDNRTDNHGDNSGDNSTPPPGPPTPENNKKSSGSSRAGEGDNHGDNSGDNSTPPDPRRQPSVTTSTGGDNRPRCATVETLVETPSAAEVLLHLRGSGRLRLSVGSALEVELSRVLGGVTPAWSTAGVERLAQHIGAGHLSKGWRPRLDDLRGRDGAWTKLLTLYDEAQDCPKCRRSEPTRREAPAPPPRDVPTGPVPKGAALAAAIAAARPVLGGGAA